MSHLQTQELYPLQRRQPVSPCRGPHTGLRAPTSQTVLQGGSRLSEGDRGLKAESLWDYSVSKDSWVLLRAGSSVSAEGRDQQEGGEVPRLWG